MPQCTGGRSKLRPHHVYVCVLLAHGAHFILNCFRDGASNRLDSKPVMDLLVTLCASYHLSPSDYTVEVLSTNKNNISFKPNSPIGSLEAEKIVLKPKGVEEKIKRPYIPEVNQIKKSLKYIRISRVCLLGDVTWTLLPTGLCSSAHQLQQVPQGRGEGESQSPPGAAAAHNL